MYFESLGNYRYRITNKAISYYFGSVKNTRFSFDSEKIIFDPLSGNIAYDSVKVLKTNSLPNSSVSIGSDTGLNVVGQTVEADGYPDDYAIEISSQDQMNNSLIDDPDFFSKLTGYQYGSTNSTNFVFIQTTTDINNLTAHIIAEPNEVVYAYGTMVQIENAKYEYPVGQIFYAFTEDKFYQTYADTTAANIVYINEITNYVAYSGRQQIYFQYKHLSNNTTRIDPGTTNIIDLYIVTLG